ncbi:cytochrome P450 [Truncatella angustata]|uniref:Cytochrome P450 n=1 Tax=Truncatella angustata TaxID=152316 RepID=A0A9P8RIG7_9PEZI|nr:cytochrome P450 [Truncatella angustata]KAH6646644.1 cytochrome P450 [Truncatella angustata]KAH8204190.1 hypothetical protein TruAng_001610 [Truncatella angustata]
MSSYASFQTQHGQLGSFRLNYANSAIIVLSSFLLFRVGLVAYRLWFHPLRRFPGPKTWAASDLPYIYTANITGTGIRQISDFHRKYGPVVRVGPNRLAMDGSVGWPQVYARRSAGEAEFEKAPGHFAPGFSKSIIASPKDVHRRQRRQLGYAFSDAAMHEQEPIIEQYVRLLGDRIHEHAASGKEMNIVQWLNFTTFDIIGDLTFGESFGSLESSNYHPWVLSIFQGIKGDSFQRACRNYRTLEPLLRYVFGDKNSNKGDENRDLSGKKGRARMEQGLEPKGRRDFITYMMQPNRDGHSGFSLDEIMANAPLLVVAGSETTASALSGLFFYLSQTPRVKRILVEEIRSAFDDESEITMVSTNKLEYLHATLEETLRVYPPAAGTPPRASPGAEIEGKFVPKGTVVHVTQWTTFRNPEHFFAPDSFYPERWLRKDHSLYDPKFDNDNHAVFKPFSHGPRDCIGKNLAYSEMRLIVSHLLYKFDVEALPGQDDWHAKQTTFNIWDKGPLYMKFTTRERQ